MLSATSPHKQQEPPMTQKTPLRPEDAQKSWSTPQLRSVIPTRRTRGGGGGANDQDDIIYDLS
jgi:hypothetical protein